MYDILVMLVVALVANILSFVMLAGPSYLIGICSRSSVGLRGPKGGWIVDCMCYSVRLLSWL